MTHAAMIPAPRWLPPSHQFPGSQAAGEQCAFVRTGE